MEAQRKKKSGRLKRRMRGALAKLARPIGRRHARDCATSDDARGLVGNEQQPEVELDNVASTSRLEVAYPHGDRPSKKPIFAKLLKVKRRIGRRKSTSGSEENGQRDRKEFETTQIPSPPETDSFGLSDSDRDPLIEVHEPDDVTSGSCSSAARLHVAEPEVEDQTAGDGEKLASDTHRLLNISENLKRESTASAGPDGQPEVDNTTRSAGEDDVTQNVDTAKHHRKRKRARRYAKRVRIFNDK